MHTLPIFYIWSGLLHHLRIFEFYRDRVKKRGKDSSNESSTLFKPTSFISSANCIPSVTACLAKTTAKLEMAPGVEHDTDIPVMTDDDSSMIDIATSNALYNHSFKEARTSSHSNHGHGLASCFGLPYQDHNYGAPPPPTPPSYSPCPSPTQLNGGPDEDTNLSVVSTSTNNDETQECSITRCVCGFEHDDEYMICCDRCLVWQHVDCMGLDRNNIPETYMCEKCQPRKVDRHKAKVLQARKKVAMSDTSDSDDEAPNKILERRPKTRSKSSKRKKDEDKVEAKSEQMHSKRNRNSKNVKERIEMKRSKLRRTKNKESTSTADEEAQDAWECNQEYCERNFESAISNQYTSEVQRLIQTVHPQGNEKKILERLQTRQCYIIEDESNKKMLVSLFDIARDQPLIEYKGKFLLASQYHEIHPIFNKRINPYLLFYTCYHEEICIDASLYGNDARFVRRSCKPNAELCHFSFDGKLHLYIASSKAIFKGDEITIPFDFTCKESLKEIECACGSDDCILKPNKKNGGIEICEKKKKGKKHASSADDDSSHSFIGSLPTKSKSSPVKNSSHQASLPVQISLAEHLEVKGTSDHETEEQANERRKKMTREERKIDAIMRAFDQMEKTAKRRQQALERIAQQKAQHPKVEEHTEKTEPPVIIKEEIPVPIIEPSPVEEEKEKLPLVNNAHKHKKGKRRRGSGTSTRRRTRTNSGGSDILSSEDPLINTGSTPITLQPLAPTSLTDSSLLPSSSTTPLTCATPTPIPVPPSPSIVTSPVILKTKRSLMNEWLQEKSENVVSTTNPLSIHTEMGWNISAAVPTCYVRCTKDGPNAGGISAAHMRRSSTSSQVKSNSGQGSAKKRWLRQAMHDSTCEEEPAIGDPNNEIISSPLHNDCVSPISSVDTNSPGILVDDIVTPLKKRRLMRESMESLTSPKSPSKNIVTLDWSNCLTNDNSTNLPSDEKIIESPKELDTMQNVKLMSTKDNTINKINGVRTYFNVIIKDTECTEIHQANNTTEENSSIEKKISNESIILSSETISNLSSKKENIQETLYIDLSQKNNLMLSEKSLTLELCETVKDASDFPKESAQSCSNNILIGAQSSIIKEIDFSSSKQSFDISNKSSVNKALNSEGNFSINLKSLLNSDVNTKADEISSSSTLGTISSDNGDTKYVFPNDPLDSNCKESDCGTLTKTNLPISNVQELPSPCIQNVVDNSLESSPQNSFSIASTPNSDSSHSLVKLDSSSSCDNENIKGIESINSEMSTINSNSPSTSTSVSQKRKVSLSEYRLRMKENSSKLRTPIKNDLSTKLSPFSEKLPENVSLAPLPFFESSSQSPIHTSSRVKKKKICSNVGEENDLEHPRENLTERLKREFGLDDDSSDTSLSSSSHAQSKFKSATHVPASPNVVPKLSLCGQPPPPPPPPPPPRPTRTSTPLPGGIPAGSPSQFTYPLTQPYPHPPYIVAQVPAPQYVANQTPIAASVLTPLHPVASPSSVPPPPPGIRPPIMSPNTPTYSSSLPTTVLRPPSQHEYSSVNAQNFATLVQPPPPPHKAYPHIYQPGLFK